MVRKHSIVLGIVLLLAVVTGVGAGNWAVITLDEPPVDVRAGETTSIGFTVLRHGETPIHDLGDGVPLEAMLVATNVATGEQIEAAGRPTKERGHFVVEVVFPSSGQWEWSIEPRPLMGKTFFDPVEVLPPLPATQADAGRALTIANAGLMQSGLFWVSAAVVMTAILLALQYNRRRAALRRQDS